MENLKADRKTESSGYSLAKRRFLDELDYLSKKFDEQDSSLGHRTLWADQIAKINAGEKLSRIQVTTLQMAIDIAHSSGLSGTEFDSFIDEFFSPRKRRSDD